MLVRKENPMGLDARIDQLQEYLHRELSKKWAGTYASYPLCLPQRRSDGKVYPEVYTGKGNFKDNFWDDKFSAVSFFGHTEYTKDHTHQTATVHLVFQCHLKKLYPTATDGRFDYQVREDVRSLVGHVMYGFHLRGVDIGLRKTFREYAGVTRSESTRNLDVHPMHCFRLNFSIVYKPDFQTLLKL